ncbi:MAG: hypothetical protein WAM81_07850 [Acidimicrobiia bacterium]
MAEHGRRKLITLVVTSCIAYAFGFLIARLTYLLGLAGFGWIEGRGPFLSHNQVVFNAAGSTLADAGGLLTVLGLGVVLALILPGPGPHGVARLTVLWTVLHVFVFALQIILVAPFQSTGVGATLAGYVHLPDTFLWILAGVAAAAIIGLGFIAGPFFLTFTPGRAHDEDRPARLQLALLIIAVPWLVGSIIAAAALLPFEGLYLSMGLTAVLAAISIVTMASSSLGQRWDATKPTLPIVPGVFLVALVWLFGFALRPGIDISPWG